MCLYTEVVFLFQKNGNKRFYIIIDKNVCSIYNYIHGSNTRKPIKHSQTVLAHLEYLTGFLVHTHKFDAWTARIWNAELRLLILNHFFHSKSSVSAINPISNYWQQGKELYLFFNFIEKTGWTLLFIKQEEKVKFFHFEKRKNYKKMCIYYLKG